MNARLKRMTARTADLLLAPLALIALLPLGFPGRHSWIQFPLTRRAADLAGTLPVPYHYFQPVYRPPVTDRPLDLTHLEIDLTVDEDLVLQLERYAHETQTLDTTPASDWDDDPLFYFGNGSFEHGDAELLYCMIRALKPRRIIEIGSGYSTLVMVAAAAGNEHQDHATTEITCIEPFERPWLDNVRGISLERSMLEDVDGEVWSNLRAGDMLFVDSSHVMRPGGDLCEILFTILPAVPIGCWIHFHDIFLPFGYPRDWIEHHKRFWNEQYMLAAFLANNSSFRPALFANWMHREHPDALRRIAPSLTDNPTANPGSAWLTRTT